MNRLITLSLLLGIASVTIAQSYNYKHFGTNNGFISTEVYQVFQDSKGYIWFATDNGVSRYNGYEFKNFTVNDGLPDNTVFDIYEDWKGKIWFIPHSGELSYFLNDSIHLFPYNKELIATIEKRPLSVKNSFFVDSLNTIYFCDRNTGVTIISEDGQINFIDKKYNIYTKHNCAFINNINPSYNILKILYDYKETQLNINLPKRYGHKQAIIADKTLFFSSVNTLYKIDSETIVQQIDMEGQIIWLSYYDKDLWVGTTKGAYCYKNGNIASDPSIKLFQDKSVSSILIDHENGTWFSTLNNGVYYLPNLQLQSLTSNNSNLSDLEISCLYMDSTSILYGSKNGEIGLIANDKPNPLTTINNGEFPSQIIDIIENNKKEKLFLTSGYIYKNIDNNYEILNKFCCKGGRSIIIDNNDSVWIMNRRGIENIAYNGEFHSSSINNKKNIEGYSALALNQNELLIGTNKGLWNYNSINKIFTQNTTIANLDGRITCLKKGTNNKLWIGTKERGLFIKHEESTTNVSTFNNLHSNYITALYNYENSMWIGTKGGGVYKMVFEDKYSDKYTIQKWSEEHGLLSNEVNDIVVNDTTAIIATNQGINILNYTKYKVNDSPPPIYIENFKINNKDRVLKEHYTLKHNENLINIKLIGLAYKLSGKLKYKYRLIGGSRHSKWNTIDIRQIQFAYLSPGKYTFEAKALNENNVESKENAIISFTIQPPFWRTIWFYLLVAISLLLIIFIIYKRNINHINKSNQLEKEFLINKNLLCREIEKYRQLALSQQMNPHFIFNSLNSIQYFIYQNNKEMSSRYLSKFSKLVRLILDNSQCQSIPFDKEFEALNLYLELEEMRLQGKLKFIIKVDKNINTTYFKVPPLLIQPYVENAIWHGIVHLKKEGYLEIILNETENHFLCTIKDNGIGRKKSMEINAKKNNLHKSIGTDITEKRLELLDKKMIIKYTDLYTESNIASGTIVEIMIPKIT